jgi:hypothetical protein
MTPKSAMLTQYELSTLAASLPTGTPKERVHAAWEIWKEASFIDDANSELNFIYQQFEGMNQLKSSNANKEKFHELLHKLLDEHDDEIKRRSRWIQKAEECLNPEPDKPEPNKPLVDFLKEIMPEKKDASERMRFWRNFLPWYEIAATNSPRDELKERAEDRMRQHREQGVPNPLVIEKFWGRWYEDRTKAERVKRAKKGAAKRHAKKVSGIGENSLGASKKPRKSRKQESAPAKQESEPAKQKSGRRKQVE